MSRAVRAPSVCHQGRGVRNGTWALVLLPAVVFHEASEEPAYQRCLRYTCGRG